MSTHIVVPDAMTNGPVGLIVWWELSGIVDYDDLKDAWLGAGFDEKTLPSRTSPEVALSRAASASLTGKRQLCRPLSKRGSWEIVYERVELDDDGNENLVWKPVVQGWVQNPGRGVGVKKPIVRVIDEEHGPLLKEAILGKYAFYERTLLTADISYWLLDLLAGPMLNATPLRSKGGFYFVPSDRVDTWRSIAHIARSVGQNVIYEIPAMRTESAIEAVLAQVKADAERQLEALADYLRGEVSTKGLNACERKAVRIREKIQNYVRTLGVALPELINWCEQITGAVQAAHLIRNAEKENAGA